MKKNLLKALELDIGNEIAIRLIKECITDNKRNRVVEKKGKRTRWIEVVIQFLSMKKKKLKE